MSAAPAVGWPSRCTPPKTSERSGGAGAVAVETGLVRAHFGAVAATTCRSVQTIDFSSTGELFGLKPSEDKVRPARAQLALGDASDKFAPLGRRIGRVAM